MKRFFGILMMVIAMMTVTTSVCAQAPNQKQRLSREQLAEKQALYISRNLGLDEKTNAKFIETYTDGRIPEAGRLHRYLPHSIPRTR